MANNDPNSLNTLAAMQARIADEIGRADLTSQIALAINDAIAIYNNERFYFNENRNLTFYSVLGQDIYSSADFPDIVNILDIDYIYCFVNGYPYKVLPSTPDELEGLSVSGVTTGLPYKYVFYGQSLRFYPAPQDNGYQFRVAAAIVSPAPGLNDTGNPWITSAERLIRSRAKYELAVNVLYDDDLAARMGGTSQDADGNPTGGATGDALKALRKMTSRMLKSGDGFVKPMDF